MKTDKITITGADDNVTYTDLLNLQEDYPFVEWGILFSESREGQKRYPSKSHRAKHFIGDLNLSAHFCGWWAKEVLVNKNYKLIADLPQQYKRVQLNFNFANSPGWNLTALLDFMNNYEGRRIILQYNRSNSPDIDKWMLQNAIPSKFHFLYDSSGGRGTEILTIERPIGGHYTGYAGGIGLDNLDPICCNIGRIGCKDSVWIDLESGARTNDNFDLKKVRDILEKFSYHAHPITK